MTYNHIDTVRAAVATTGFRTGSSAAGSGAAGSGAADAEQRLLAAALGRSPGEAKIALRSLRPEDFTSWSRALLFAVIVQKRQRRQRWTANDLVVRVCNAASPIGAEAVADVVHEFHLIWPQRRSNAAGLWRFRAEVLGEVYARRVQMCGNRLAEARVDEFPAVMINERRELRAARHRLERAQATATRRAAAA